VFPSRGQAQMEHDGCSEKVEDAHCCAKSWFQRAHSPKGQRDGDLAATGTGKASA